MTLGRKDFSKTRPDSGAHVFGLAGFLRDDDLIGHDGLLEESIPSRGVRTYSEQRDLASWRELSRPAILPALQAQIEDRAVLELAGLNG